MVDCQFVAAMGLPGGGRTFITPRFARHFHHVGICEFDGDTMTRIFSTILGHFFTKVRLLFCLTSSFVSLEPRLLLFQRI